MYPKEMDMELLLILHIITIKEFQILLEEARNHFQCNILPVCIPFELFSYNFINNITSSNKISEKTTANFT